MPLDATKLGQTLLVAFGKGMTEPDWSKEDAAQAMADAIHAYVLDATVVGVTVDVVAPNGTSVGTGTQSGNGSLQ